MSRYNRGAVRTRPSSPVTSKPEPGLRTALGAPGYSRDRQSELYLLASCNLPGEKVFHEGRDARVTRFRDLVRENAAASPDWTGGLLGYLRGPGNLRLAPVIAAAEYTWARSGLYKAGTIAPAEDYTIRRVVNSVLQRADEPGEIVAYWISQYGRKSMPIGFKRGVADAVLRLYTERGLLKYDTAEAAIRFADVIELVQPRYHGRKYGTWQDALFRYAIERRHGRDDPERNAIPESLRTIRRHREMMEIPAAERKAFLRTPEASAVIRDAGVTWEALAGWLQGPMDAAAWQAMIPSMGYMALVRNLANFDRAGIPDDIAEKVIAKLTDPAEVAWSRQFPFRFLSAYNEVKSLRWGYPLEKALNLSLANIPALKGWTLVLVDRSPSMWEMKLSEHSEMDWADAAAVFAAAIALRAEKADLAEFWAASKPVHFSKGESVLKLVKKFSVKPAPGGTDIPAAVRQHLKPHHTRVVIITDEQTRAGWLPSNMGGMGRSMWRDQFAGCECMPETRIDDLIPKSVPVTMWNFAGYKTGAMPSGGDNRHTLGGLTDSAFRAISVLESGRDSTWPWLQEAPAAG